jgi:hypothetical protein
MKGLTKTRVDSQDLAMSMFKFFSEESKLVLIIIPI